MARLEGKVAIVTGASRGIGAAIALGLAEEGARVVFNYRSGREEAESLAARAGGVPVQADVSSAEDVRRLWDSAEAAFGPVDILVNNAGIAIFKPVAEMTDEDFDRTMATNARGPFLLAREAARRLRDGGRIINISTGATVGGTAGGAFYCGSKATLEQLTRALARELGPRRITVNTVSPGFTETGMLAQFPRLVKAAPAMTPLGRVGQPEDVAAVVVWLCTAEGGWVTGQNIQAGGGASML
jgi:3-oxoacyl-[acyl-carrier protein] reductase